MSWGGKGCSQMLLFIPWLINTERKWETLTGLSGAPEEDSSQLWCFHLPTQPTWSFSRARRAPLRQRRQGYYPLWWHPPKSFSATGTTSSQAMTRGWEQLFGIWKLLRSPSAETGILMASQSHDTKLRRGWISYMPDNTVFCSILLLFSLRGEEYRKSKLFTAAEHDSPKYILYVLYHNFLHLERVSIHTCY